MDGKGSGTSSRFCTDGRNDRREQYGTAAFVRAKGRAYEKDICKVVCARGVARGDAKSIAVQKPLCFPLELVHNAQTRFQEVVMGKSECKGS